MTSVPQTTPAVLDRIARALPDHEALVTPDRTLTFSELRDEVRRAAAAMIDLGVAPGDRVTIWSPNTWHWVVACLATHYAGAVLVPLNTRYTATEAADILARTQAPLLISAGEFLGTDRSLELDRAALPALRAWRSLQVTPNTPAPATASAWERRCASMMSLRRKAGARGGLGVARQPGAGRTGAYQYHRWRGGAV